MINNGPPLKSPNSGKSVANQLCMFEAGHEDGFLRNREKLTFQFSAGRLDTLSWGKNVQHLVLIKRDTNQVW